LSSPSVRQHVDDENGHEITFLILKFETPNPKSIRDSGLINAALKSCRSIFGFVLDWGMQYSGFSNGAWNKYNNMIASPLQTGCCPNPFSLGSETLKGIAILGNRP
jgi:hypothetical protein